MKFIQQNSYYNHFRIETLRQPHSVIPHRKLKLDREIVYVFVCLFFVFLELLFLGREIFTNARWEETNDFREEIARVSNRP
jgi:hypothetical protein